GREGAGADTRREGAERAGATAGAARRTGVARRTGAGRGAVTVTSGSVSVTWAQVTFSNIKAPDSVSVPTAVPCNRRRLLAVSRDAPRPCPPATYTARPHEASQEHCNIPAVLSCDLLTIRIRTFGNVAARTHMSADMCHTRKGP